MMLSEFYTITHFENALCAIAQIEHSRHRSFLQLNGQLVTFVVCLHLLAVDVEDYPAGAALCHKR